MGLPVDVEDCVWLDVGDTDGLCVGVGESVPVTLGLRVGLGVPVDVTLGLTVTLDDSVSVGDCVPGRVLVEDGETV